MQEDGAPEPPRGINGVLGGGKTTEEVAAEKSPIVEAASIFGFVFVLAGLTFGAVNPDYVESIAKSQSKCVEGKIVNGYRTQCNPDGTFMRDR